MNSVNPSPHNIRVPEPLRNLVLSWGIPLEAELAFYLAIETRVSGAQSCDFDRLIPLEITVPSSGGNIFRAYGHIRIRLDDETGELVIIDATFYPLMCDET